MSGPEHGSEGGPEHHNAAYEGAERVATGESWLGRAAHLAHYGVEAAEHAGMIGELGGVAGTAAEALPFVGALAGGVSAGVNTGLAIDDFSREGVHSDEGWNHVGGAVLGGAGAALSCTPYGAALAAGEIATDVAGAGAGWAFGDNAKFSADSVVGGLVRGTVGDRSTGYQAGTAVSDALGGGALGTTAGVLAGIGTEAVALPYDLARTVGGGIANEVGAIGSAIYNGDGAVGGALHDFGVGAANVATDAWHGAGNLASSAATGVGNLASGAWDGMKSAGGAIADFLSDERLKTDIKPIANALELL